MEGPGASRDVDVRSREDRWGAPLDPKPVPVAPLLGRLLARPRTPGALLAHPTFGFLFPLVAGHLVALRLGGSALAMTGYYLALLVIVEGWAGLALARECRWWRQSGMLRDTLLAPDSGRALAIGFARVATFRDGVRFSLFALSLLYLDGGSALVIGLLGGPCLLAVNGEGRGGPRRVAAGVYGFYGATFLLGNRPGLLVFFAFRHLLAIAIGIVAVGLVPYAANKVFDGKAALFLLLIFISLLLYWYLATRALRSLFEWILDPIAGEYSDWDEALRASLR